MIIWISHLLGNKSVLTNVLLAQTGSISLLIIFLYPIQHSFNATNLHISQANLQQGGATKGLRRLC